MNTVLPVTKQAAQYIIQHRQTFLGFCRTCTDSTDEMPSQESEPVNSEFINIMSMEASVANEAWHSCRCCSHGM